MKHYISTYQIPKFKSGLIWAKTSAPFISASVNGVILVILQTCTFSCLRMGIGPTGRRQDKGIREYGRPQGSLWEIPIRRAKQRTCTVSEPTRSHVMWEMILGFWDGRGGRQERHWQLVHPWQRETSPASCHVVFVAWWWSTEHRPPRLLLLARPHYPISSEVTQWGRIFSVAPVSSLSLVLCFSRPSIFTHHRLCL